MGDIGGRYGHTLAGYEIEATFGTDPAATRIVWPWDLASIKPSGVGGKRTPSYGIGGGRQPRAAYIEHDIEHGFSIEGSILNDSPTNSILAMALADAVPNVTTGAITLSDLIDSFSFEHAPLLWAGTDDFWLRKACRINQLTLTQGSGFLKGAADVFCRKPTLGTAEIATSTVQISDLVYPAVRPFRTGDWTVTFANGLSTPGTPTEIVTTIDNKLERIPGSGSDDAREYFPTQRDIFGTIKMPKEANQLRDIAVADPNASAGQTDMTQVWSKNAAAEYISLAMTDIVVLSTPDIGLAEGKKSAIQETLAYHMIGALTADVKA